jgi:GDP-L-fucose synthase
MIMPNSVQQLKKTFIAGHNGLVGRALKARLEIDPHRVVITAGRDALDLRDKSATFKFFDQNKPDELIISAAKVGGIGANMAQPVAFLVENLEIQNNLMLAAAEHGCETIMMIGSSCIYPREASQPIAESAFMTGHLEPTNESYAVAKIAGIRLAQALHQEKGIRVILPMPCNVFGPGDHFDLERAHVASALVKRYVDARNSGVRSVTLWGTGSAKREFIYSTDLADACHFLLERWNEPEIINVGTGLDISIRDLSSLIAELVGYQGETLWDASRPNGMQRKVLNIQKLSSLGWSPTTSLRIGLSHLISEYESTLVS